MEQNEAGYAGPWKPHYEFGSLCSSNGKPLKITFECEKFSLATVRRIDWRALPECQAWQRSCWKCSGKTQAMDQCLLVGQQLEQVLIAQTPKGQEKLCFFLKKSNQICLRVTTVVHKQQFGARFCLFVMGPNPSPALGPLQCLRGKTGGMSWGVLTACSLFPSKKT